MGMTITESQATLDARFPTSGAGDYIAYSINGTSEWANLARTAIGATGWSAATAADPSVKQNANQLNSAAVITAGGTVTHYAIYSASIGGTQRISWQAMDNPRVLAVGESLQWAANTCKVTLT